MTKQNTLLQFDELFRDIIQSNVNEDTRKWLREKAMLCADPENSLQLNLTFTSMPRKTGRNSIQTTTEEDLKISHLLPGLAINHWTIDRLCRVWLLMQTDSSNKERYIKRVEGLFPQAEMNEQVALYSSLPFLNFPEEWKLQCAVGIRSNIDNVLEAIMYHNPYPAAFLEEAAWNQLVMKAFFTGKSIHKICGIDERANHALALMLFDYVEERWAAHRPEDPQIWRLTGRYLDDPHLYMMETLFREGNEKQKKAAALSCAASSHKGAEKLLDEYPSLREALQNNALTWAFFAGEETSFNLNHLKN